MSLLRYPKTYVYSIYRHVVYQVWTFLDNLFLNYTADKQTNKQTYGLERPTHADPRYVRNTSSKQEIHVCESTIYVTIATNAEINSKQGKK